MVDRARRRFRSELAGGRLILREGTLSRLPVDKESLDGVITVNTVYFIAELDQALGEIARDLKATGVAVIGLGDPDEMARAPFTAYGFRLRPVEDVIAAAEAAGLELREHSCVGAAKGGAHLLAFSRRTVD